jgi:hypothetical protein
VSRIFLLSPANCGGRRATQVTSPRARCPLAAALRRDAGAPLGDVFSFMSGLYFRGKLSYARRFARPADRDCPVVGSGVLVITPNAGLCAPDTPVTRDSIRAFARVDIDLANGEYVEPLVRSARAVNDAAGPGCEVVLLGSIASGKYVDALLPIFGPRLAFPRAFVGRGDMSRGGLMLRCVTDGRELDYIPLDGAVRRGRRPPKLTARAPVDRR